MVSFQKVPQKFRFWFCTKRHLAIFPLFFLKIGKTHKQKKIGFLIHKRHLTQFFFDSLKEWNFLVFSQDFPPSFVCFWGNEPFWLFLSIIFAILHWEEEVLRSRSSSAVPIVCYSEVKSYYQNFYNRRNLDCISNSDGTEENGGGWNNKFATFKQWSQWLKITQKCRI